VTLSKHHWLPSVDFRASGSKGYPFNGLVKRSELVREDCEESSLMAHGTIPYLNLTHLPHGLVNGTDIKIKKEDGQI
jgi:hypothetical protein